MVSTATAAKDKGAKEAAFKVLACCAMRYKQLEHLLATLADMLNKDEHMSVVCAELPEYAAKRLGDNQLVRLLCTMPGGKLCTTGCCNRHTCCKSCLQ